MPRSVYLGHYERKANDQAREEGYRNLAHALRVLTEAGASEVRLAEKFNVSRQTVRAWKDKLGVVTITRTIIRKKQGRT